MAPSSDAALGGRLAEVELNRGMGLGSLGLRFIF